MVECIDIGNRKQIDDLDRETKMTTIVKESAMERWDDLRNRISCLKDPCRRESFHRTAETKVEVGMRMMRRMRLTWMTRRREDRELTSRLQECPGWDVVGRAEVAVEECCLKERKK